MKRIETQRMRSDRARETRIRRDSRVAFASMVIIVGISLAIYSYRQLTEARSDLQNCEAWNTEEYFEGATASGVAACIRAGADVRAVGAEGATPLILATALSDDADVLEVLLGAGADANERIEIDGTWLTPLLLAAARRDATAAISILVDNGADPNIRGYEGSTALHVAAERDLPDAVSLLLDLGANPGAVDERDRTPLRMVADDFAKDWDHHGRIANLISVIRILLDRGGDVRDLTDRGWTDLHTAALLGNEVGVVTALLHQGLDPNAETSSGWAPLHLAAFSNENSSVISTLLESGASVDARIGDGRTVLREFELSRRGVAQPDVRIGDGRTPLHVAAFANPNPIVIAALLEGGADADAKTTTGWTPLHAAAYANSQSDVITALLNGGADANSKLNESWTFGDLFPRTDITTSFDTDRDIDNVLTLSGNSVRLNGASSPLHAAVARYSESSSATAVLILGGADPNARDINGETPLHQVRDSDVAAMLVEAGADPNARSASGRVPLHEVVSAAAYNRNIELVSTLIDLGADPNLGGEAGWTPLHTVSLSIGGEDIRVELISLLIRRGADPHARNVRGATPLHTAALSGATTPAVVDALVSGGADPNSRNLLGESPLFSAVAPSLHYIGAGPRDHVVTRLIDAVADPNLQDETGKTPLHVALVHFGSAPALDDLSEFMSASPFSDSNVVDALLDGGASAAVSDEQGVTPWDLAQMHESLKGTNTYWRLNEARFD